MRVIIVIQEAQLGYDFFRISITIVRVASGLTAGRLS